MEKGARNKMETEMYGAQLMASYRKGAQRGRRSKVIPKFLNLDTDALNSETW